MLIRGPGVGRQDRRPQNYADWCALRPQPVYSRLSLAERSSRTSHGELGPRLPLLLLRYVARAARALCRPARLACDHVPQLAGLLWAERNVDALGGGRAALRMDDAAGDEADGPRTLLLCVIIYLFFVSAWSFTFIVLSFIYFWHALGVLPFIVLRLLLLLCKFYD